MNHIWWHKWDASIRIQEKKGTAMARYFSVLKVFGGNCRIGEERVPEKRTLLPLKFSNYSFLPSFPSTTPGVCLESSKLCMPDLPHLLAFLSASRYRSSIKGAKEAPSL